jgi:DNA polymerase III sliding clamp (beta) subunit (PCNA family)
MKVKFEDIQEFKEAVKKMAAYTGGSLQSYHALKFDADSKGLWVSATTGDSYCRLNVMAAEIIETGTIGIDQKRLAGVLAEISGPVTLSGAKDLKLETGRGKMTVKGFPVDDIPEYPEPEADKEWFELPSNWADIVNWAGAVPLQASENRPHIKGAYFTDGRILSTNSRELRFADTGIKFNESFLLLKQGLLGLPKVFPSSSVLRMAAEPGMAFFSNGSITVSLTKLEGHFPNIDGIKGMFGAGTTFRFTTDISEFAGGVKRANSFYASNDAPGLYITVCAGCNSIRLNIASPIGDFDETIPIETIAKPPGSINEEERCMFQPKYLSDILSRCSNRNVEIELNNQPMIYVNDPDRNASAVLMGMTG